MIEQIQVGHRYQLSLSSYDDIGSDYMMDIHFAEQYPLRIDYGIVTRLYQRSSDGAICLEDADGVSHEITYPFSLVFTVESWSGAPGRFVNYMDEILKPITANLSNVGANFEDIPYGQFTEFIIEPYLYYRLPSNITVTNAEYTWDSENGILALKPNPRNLVNDLTVRIVGIRTYTITINNDHSYSSNPQTVIDSNQRYETKLIANAGYLIDTVTVTVGGTVISDAYDTNTHIVTISNVNGDIVIDVTTKVDDSELTMYTYRNSAEKKRVNKTDYLLPVDTIHGTFRKITDVIKPIIEIEYNTVPDFNYVYINTLKRYYFVDNITSVSKNIWQIALIEDVLMTYASIIKQQKAHVSRQENIFDENLNDENRAFRKDISYQVEEITTDAFDVDKTGTTIFGNVDRGVRFVLTVVGDN